MIDYSLADQYIESVLKKYSVLIGPGSPAATAAERIAPVLGQWAGQWLKGLSYSGSYAKGTAISLGTDVDLFISLSSGTPGTLKEIFDSLYAWAVRQGWNPRRQTVSIGISTGGVKIDLVPGRVQEGFQNYHSIYDSKKISWTQTNVSLHIDAIKNSNRLGEIRAMKIWRSLHRLDFPSFYLELFVMEALKYKPTDQLAVNVYVCLQSVVDKILTMRLVDPANTNNIVSDDLSKAEKLKVMVQAKLSLAKKTWGEIVW